MKRISLLCIALVLAAVDARAQSWTAPRTWSTGEQVTATIMNAHVRDNELILRAGGLSVSSQAIGDLLCASSTTQFARLADVATGSVLQSGGVGACPAWSSILAITGFGTHSISAGGTGNQALLVTNTSSGTTNAALLRATAGTTVGQLISFSQGYTTGSYDVQASAAFTSNGAGGISIAATDAAGVVRFYTGGTTEKARLRTDLLSTNTFQLLDGAWGPGAVSGSYVLVGRNTSGSAAAGGYGMITGAGGGFYIWTDGAGNLRIHSALPTANGSVSDTAGTVVGTQTSTLDSKLLIAPFTDTRHALDVVAGAALWRFRYKSGVAGEFMGVMSNTTPEVMMDPSPEHPEGRSFSPVSAFGWSAAAIAELRKQVDRLRNPFLVSFGPEGR
jgi:hypothetical protein